MFPNRENRGGTLIHKKGMNDSVFVGEWKEQWRLLKSHFLLRRLLSIEKGMSEPGLFSLFSFGHLVILARVML